MRRLFALDQNYPQPIVDSLREWLAADAELVPIADVHPQMATIEDWEVLLALHTDRRPWDGLITTDVSMLSLPRELAVLCQTKLTLVVAVAAGHDPIKATGLVFAHISNICERTRPDAAQVWRLATTSRPADDPWDYLGEPRAGEARLRSKRSDASGEAKRRWANHRSRKSATYAVSVVDYATQE